MGQTNKQEDIIKVSLDYKDLQQGLKASKALMDAYEKQLAQFQAKIQAMGGTLGQPKYLGSRYRTETVDNGLGMVEQHKIQTAMMSQSVNIGGKAYAKFSEFEPDAGKWKLVNTETIKLKDSTKALGEANKDTMLSYGKLAARAIAVIPIWMALRSAYMALITTIQEGIQYVIEFDKALARVKSVLFGVSDSTKFIKDLSGEIRLLAQTTGVSANEAAEAFYRFGSAGLDAQVAVAGMNTAIKMSVALMGNSTETARILADLYVLLGDRIEGATTPQEKMNYFASTIGTLWRDNTFELNEFTEGLKTFAATGTNFNLTVDQMMSLLATTHTLMQRGGAGGTQLSRVFLQLAKDTKTVGRYLNADADALIKQKGYYEVFIDVLRKLNSELQAGIPVMDEIQELFDIRASKTVAGFTEKFDLLVKTLNKLSATPVAERMKVLNELFQNQIDTVSRQLELFDIYKKQSVEAFILAATGADSLVDALKELNTFMRDTVIPTFIFFGVIAERMKKHPGASLFGPLGPLMPLRDKFLKFDKNTGKWVNEQPKSVMDEVVENLQKYYASLDKAKEKSADIKKPSINVASIERDITGTTEYRLLLLDKLKARGIDEIEIEKRKLEIIIDTNAQFEQKLKIQRMINEEQLKYAEIFSSTLEDSLYKTLKGEQGFSSVFKDLQTAQIDTFRKEIASGLTNMISATGMGESFAKPFLDLKSIFGGMAGKIESAHATVYNYIVKGHIDGMSMATVSGSQIAGMGGDVFTGGVGGTTNIIPGFGNVWSPYSSSGGGGGFGALSNKYGSSKGRGLFASVGGAKNVGSSALIGYSMYQSSKSRGASQGISSASGVMTGLGMLGAMSAFSSFGAGMAGYAGTVGGLGMSAGGMGGVMAGLGAIGPVGWVGLAVLAAGLALGFMGGGKKSAQTSVETKTTENKISSRIDVTNKNLEIINRNLLALKASVETYMLPSSAYFAEKRNIEDQFALFSRRGFMG